jgi:alginate O-acetyltransferase complex protein AlgJ
MRNLFHHRFGGAALCLFFVICICLPLAGLVLGLDPTPPLRENRELAAMPNLTLPISAVLQHPTGSGGWSGLFQALTWYPADFTRYFNDHFGFRGLLVRMHSLLVLLGWPAKGDVIVGRQGWLFFGESRIRESYQASTPFTAQELANWQRELERRRDWLAAQGSDYLLVVAPEKSTMYPDFMPANIPRLGQQKRLDQLVGFLAENSNLQVIDPREALVEARAQRPTYYRTDSHWNDWGAFIVYQQILARLSERHPNLHPKSATDYTFLEYDTSGNDLAAMLGLEGLLRDQAMTAEPATAARARRADTGVAQLPGMAWWAQPEAREVPDEDAPRAIMVRDSFGTALIPFLSEHCRRIVYVHPYSMDEAVLLRERPSIVIEEMAERELQAATPPHWGKE